MHIYGAATLGNGHKYTLDGDIAYNDSDGSSLTIPQFIEVANEFSVTDIVGTSTLCAHECSWYVRDGEEGIELLTHEDVCDWLTTFMVEPVAS